MFKKWILISLKVAVSGGLIWYITKDLNLQEAFVQVRQIDPLMLSIAIVFFGSQICIGGLRWRAVSIAIQAPLTLFKSLRLFYIGLFFNQALPGGTGGDAVRMYMAYRSGLELRGAINGVMLERMVTVLALVVMVDITQPFFVPETNKETADLINTAAIILTFLAFGGLTFIMFLDRMPEKMSKWRVVRGLGYLADDTRRIFLNFRHCLTSVSWGMLTHLNLSFVVFLLASGLALPVTFIDCLILVPPVVLATTVPISIGGWGVREVAMVAAFGLIGIPQESAVVLSVLIGIVALMISLPGGVLWLLGRGRDPGSDLKHMETELSAPKP